MTRATDEVSAECKRSYSRVHALATSNRVQMIGSSFLFFSVKHDFWIFFLCSTILGFSHFLLNKTLPINWLRLSVASWASMQILLVMSFHQASAKWLCLGRKHQDSHKTLPSSQKRSREESSKENAFPENQLAKAPLIMPLHQQRQI